MRLAEPFTSNLTISRHTRCWFGASFFVAWAPTLPALGALHTLLQCICQRNGGLEHSANDMLINERIPFSRWTVRHMNPKIIIAKAADKYKRCNSYTDSGTAAWQESGRADHCSFATYFVRPRRLHSTGAVPRKNLVSELVARAFGVTELTASGAILTAKWKS